MAERGSPGAGDPDDPLVAGYGLTRERAARIRASTRALEAVGIRRAAALPFDAEPFGFGERLLDIARRHDTG
jgi:hypothetical protein